jgi:branched-subunit amino acid ABC-type transport system permease component
MQLLIILVTLALMAGFTTFITTTPLGRAQHASSGMAALLGVDVDRVISTTFNGGGTRGCRGADGHTLLRCGRFL